MKELLIGLMCEGLVIAALVMLHLESIKDEIVAALKLISALQDEEKLKAFCGKFTAAMRPAAPVAPVQPVQPDNPYVMRRGFLRQEDPSVTGRATPGLSDIQQAKANQGRTHGQ